MPVRHPLALQGHETDEDAYLTVDPVLQGEGENPIRCSVSGPQGQLCLLSLTIQ